MPYRKVVNIHVRVVDFFFFSSLEVLSSIKLAFIVQK